MDIVTIAIIIAAALTTLILISIVWPGTVGAPWWPSTRKQIRRMLEMADVQPGDVVYDLGSGDGRILITAAREFGAYADGSTPTGPSAAIGIEVDLLHVLWTRLRITLLGLQDRIEIRWSNFFNEDLSAADVVIVHLRQDTNIELMPKLWRELRPARASSPTLSSSPAGKSPTSTKNTNSTSIVSRTMDTTASRTMDTTASRTMDTTASHPVRATRESPLVSRFVNHPHMYSLSVILCLLARLYI